MEGFNPVSFRLPSDFSFVGSATLEMPFPLDCSWVDFLKSIHSGITITSDL